MKEVLLETQSNTIFNFEKLISPISKEEFFDKYFEKECLILTRDDQKYFSELLTMSDIDNLLYSQVLRFPAVRMTKVNEDILANAYAIGDRINTPQVLKLMTEGATLILSGLHEFLPKLSLLCASLVTEFGHKFQTNIYITPKQSQGFNVHYDTHDVFILQVKGKKKWRIYKDNPLELPNKLQEFEKGKYEHGELDREFILNEGDILYIPRGIMHDADTLDELSIHITTGLLGYTLADFLVEGISDLSKKNAYLRKYVHPDLMNNSSDKEAVTLFNQLLSNLSSNLIPSEIIDRMKNELVKNQKLNIPNLIANSIEIDNINPATEFSKIRGLEVNLYTTEDVVTIEWIGKKVEFPAFTLPAIAFIVSNKSQFSLKDIPDCIDDDGKITLLKRLTKEGLITIIS